MAAKLKIDLVNTFTQETKFSLIYNSDFGTRLFNYAAQTSTAITDTYLEIDLDLIGGKTDKLFFVLFKERLYVTAGGLAFTDVIYSEPFLYDPVHGRDMASFELRVDQGYYQPESLQVNWRVLKDSVPKVLLQ